jgi:hypothetical protein
MHVLDSGEGKLPVLRDIEVPHALVKHAIQMVPDSLYIIPTRLGSHDSFALVDLHAVGVHDLTTELLR